ncbi:MAG: hypothetical protein HYR50_05240 [Candidatus Rokubacteria bacterium]|nr:hypothetical protein [Candidatus Rokubacteria bacterium]
MATSAGISNFKKPWAWLAAIAALVLALGSSTALYVVNPVVKLQQPWWAAVAAPALVYGLVLPLCVPRMRIGGWLAGFFTLAILHVGIALATAWLYARVGFISFEQALAPALWGFPPALVLAMVGSLVMTLPFLGALAPRAAAPRPQAGVTRARAGATKQPRQAPEIIPSKDRRAWARISAGAEHESAASAPVAKAVGALPAMAVAAPALAGPPPAVAKLPVVVPDEPAARVVEETLEAPDELVAPEPSFSAAIAADAPATLEAPAPAAAVVRIPFDRVVGQLPPGAFRVPLGQVGARLREAETLVVPQDVVLPQLGEGVVQVAWEVVVEQFPAAVFAVAPAEVKERIVKGRLLLPLDEIVRQLPPDVFAASIGREPVEVPGIESCPAPIEAPVQARTIERGAFPGPQMAHPESRGDTETLAALLAPWETAALEKVQVGDFAIISVSATGLASNAVAAAAGRLSPLIARRAPRPVEQATLRGVGGALVLTPVGSGWNTGTALAVGLHPGGPLARLEILARRAAAAHDPGSPAAERQAVTPATRFDYAPPPPTVAAEDLEAFGPLTAQSYREPTSGALIHCFVSPAASAGELAPFAWELAQVMEQCAQVGALGSFHSAFLRSGSERLEIRRLSSSTGPAPVLVVSGADTGRPGLARLQVERTAARLSGA